jgi:hypothetical protein
MAKYFYSSDDALESHDLLDSFVLYCMEHPHERFWQALLGWVSQTDREAVKIRVEFADGVLADTFYWEQKNGR